jgi:hypothetical protein
MRNLLKRLRKIANAHPNIEVGANIYYYKRRYHIGQIQKGKAGYVDIKENDRMCGSFHSHIHNLEPSKGDW